MAKSTRLGKGLGALLGDAAVDGAQAADGDRVLAVELHRLDPNPYQPRTVFDDDALDELAQSIAAHGVLQPLLVIDGEAGRYTIVAGERRWRAARRAGLSTVPVIVRNYDDRTLMEAALIENLQRADLNPVEEAEAIHTLMHTYGLTQEGVAACIGKSRPAVANALRLLSLSAPVLAMVREGALSGGHARAVLMVAQDEQHAFAQHIIAHGLSVRQAEALAQANKRGDKPRKERVAFDPHLLSAQDALQRVFGTRVAVSGNLSRGRIAIEYYSRDDLERIYEMLLARNEGL
jgi:ParB family chromosome partitioning protein